PPPSSGRSSGRGRQVRGTATGCRSCGSKAASGRREWPNRDPLGIKGGINLYSFARNGSINSIDPFGDFVYFGPTGVLLPGLSEVLPPTENLGDILGVITFNYFACRAAVRDAMFGAEQGANANFGRAGQMHGNEGSIPDMLTHCVGACEVAKHDGPC